MFKVLDGVRDAASRLCESERTLSSSAEVECEVVRHKVDNFTTRYNNLEGQVRDLNIKLSDMTKVQRSMQDNKVIIEEACIEAESQLLCLEAPDMTDGPTTAEVPQETRKSDKLRNILDALVQRSPDSTNIRSVAKDILNIDGSHDNVHAVEGKLSEEPLESCG